MGLLDRGWRMQQVSKVLPERFISCSKTILLECRCGENLLLLGREADWRKEGHTIFECSGCGMKLSVADSSRRRVLRTIKVLQL